MSIRSMYPLPGSWSANLCLLAWSAQRRDTLSAQNLADLLSFPATMNTSTISLRAHKLISWTICLVMMVNNHQIEIRHTSPSALLRVLPQTFDIPAFCFLRLHDFLLRFLWIPNWRILWIVASFSSRLTQLQRTNTRTSCLFDQSHDICFTKIALTFGLGVFLWRFLVGDKRWWVRVILPVNQWEADELLLVYCMQKASYSRL